MASNGAIVLKTGLADPTGSTGKTDPVQSGQNPQNWEKGQKPLKPEKRPKTKNFEKIDLMPGLVFKNMNGAT